MACYGWKSKFADVCRLGFWLRLQNLQAFARKSWALSRGFQAEPSHNITNLQSVFSLFPPKTDVTLERLGAASGKLVHRFCSYKRTNLKKNWVKTHTCSQFSACIHPKLMQLRNGWAQPLANWYTDFVAIREQIKTRIKKIGWKLIPAVSTVTPGGS